MPNRQQNNFDEQVRMLRMSNLLREGFPAVGAWQGNLRKNQLYCRCNPHYPPISQTNPELKEEWDIERNLDSGLEWSDPKLTPGSKKFMS